MCSHPYGCSLIMARDGFGGVKRWYGMGVLQAVSGAAPDRLGGDHHSCTLCAVSRARHDNQTSMWVHSTCPCTFSLLWRRARRTSHTVSGGGTRHACRLFMLYCVCAARGYACRFVHRKGTRHTKSSNRSRPKSKCIMSRSYAMRTLLSCMPVESLGGILICQ